MASVRHIPEPVGYLENVITTLREAARDPAGLHLDPELCRGLAEGLGDVLDGVELLIALAEEVRAAAAPEPERLRTPAERAGLARLAVALDPDGVVIAFPAPARGPAAFEGGTAA